MASPEDWLSVSGQSEYFSDQREHNQLVRDLIKGLSAMRGGRYFEQSSKVSRYLPQFENEPDHIYENRVLRSYLTNYFKRAIQSDVGKVVSSPLGVTVNENQELPEYSESWFDDIDLEGKGLDTFAKDQLEASLYKGVTLAFVDFVNEEGFQRPFVHPIDIDYVTNFKADRRTGRITELEWSSIVVSDSEDEGVVSKEGRWVITPTQWELYYTEEDNDVPAESGEIVRYKNNGNTRITDEIPISIMYTNKLGRLLASSPYETLAELTVEHFQVSSDIKNNLFYALTPMLFAKGMPDEVKLQALAAWQAVTISDENPEALAHTDISWIQASAAPIKEAREQLKDIEYRISSFGIDASSGRPSGNQTAIQTAINSAGSNAALLGFAAALQNHMEDIVRIMFSYMPNDIKDIQVELTSDFDLSDNNDKAATAITAAEKGIISPYAATVVMKQNNILGKDYDYYEDMAMKIEDGEPDIIPQVEVSDAVSMGPPENTE